MAKRPIAAKKMKKLRKLLRRTPDSYINLIEYLIDRGYANTVGGARAMLVDGRVRVDSHVVGRRQLKNELPDGTETTEWVPDPLVKAEYRDKFLVST